MRRVHGGELRGLGRRRPEPEPALIVGAAAQHGEGRVERTGITALHGAEFGTGGDDERRHAFAHQLLRARVLVVLEIRGQPLSPDQRQG